MILVARAQFGAPRLDLSLPTSLPSSTAWVVVEKVMEADSSSNLSKLLMEQRSTSGFQRGLDSGLAKAAPSAVGPLPEDLSVVLQEAGTLRPRRGKETAVEGAYLLKMQLQDVAWDTHPPTHPLSSRSLAQSPFLPRRVLSHRLRYFGKISPQSFALVHHTGPFAKRILPNWTWNIVG